MDPNELFQPSDREFLERPYETYKLLRQEHPVFRRSDSDRSWVVSRYSDVASVLSDPLLGTARVVAESERFAGGEAEHFDDRGHILWYTDPPEHTDLRRRVMWALAAEVQRVAATLDEMALRMMQPLAGSSASFDFMESFARPFVGRVTCDVLGLPQSDAPILQEWSREAVEASDLDVSNGRRLRATLAGLRLSRYFEAHLAGHEADKTDDLVGRLLGYERRAPAFGVRTLHINLVMLLVAAQETTVNLLGNGIRMLAEREIDLRARPASAVTLRREVDELLRFDSPSQSVLRTARAPASIRDVRIDRGDKVLAIVGSANRDEGMFQRSDELNLHRDPNKHLAFAHGPHLCIGATLARLEGQALLAALRSLPVRPVLAASPVRRQHFVFRGFEELALEFVP